MSGHETSLTLGGVAWRLGATAFFVALNGFFVAAEFALVKVRASKLETLAAEGRRSARVAHHLTQHLDRYLSGCQLGITLASLILGALGEPAVSQLLLAAAGGLGLEVTAGPWVSGVSIALAFAVITVLHMTVGEQAPKMWALRKAESTALRVALPLRLFTLTFGPLIAGINALSNWMLRLAGLPVGHGVETTHTAEEIRSILSLSARAGHISEHELELTENVFRMVELEVRHIVVPRVDVVYLSLRRSLDENLATVRESGHSRLPLCEDDLDSIVGFVHAREVLDAMVADGRVDLRALAREPLVVPDTMPLAALLRELQLQRSHCAAVADEHGSIMGLVFREDALEEVVGPLGDEFDEESPWFRELADGGFEVHGRLSLPEARDRLGLTVGDDEGAETIGGLIVAMLGRLPRQGDVVELDGYHATVVEVLRRRVQRIRFERQAAASAGDAATGEG